MELTGFRHKGLKQIHAGVSAKGVPSRAEGLTARTLIWLGSGRFVAPFAAGTLEWRRRTQLLSARAD